MKKRLNSIQNIVIVTLYCINKKMNKLNIKWNNFSVHLLSHYFPCVTQNEDEHNEHPYIGSHPARTKNCLKSKCSAGIQKKNEPNPCKDVSVLLASGSGGSIPLSAKKPKQEHATSVSKGRLLQASGVSGNLIACSLAPHNVNQQGVQGGVFGGRKERRNPPQDAPNAQHVEQGSAFREEGGGEHNWFRIFRRHRVDRSGATRPSGASGPSRWLRVSVKARTGVLSLISPREHSAQLRGAAQSTELAGEILRDGFVLVCECGHWLRICWEWSQKGGQLWKSRNRFGAETVAEIHKSNRKKITPRKWSRFLDLEKGKLRCLVSLLVAISFFLSHQLCVCLWGVTGYTRLEVKKKRISRRSFVNILAPIGTSWPCIVARERIPSDEEQLLQKQLWGCARLAVGGNFPLVWAVGDSASTVERGW